MTVLKIRKKEENIDELVVQYDKLRMESKTIKTRMDELAKKIKEFALTNGVKDDKGSCYCENESFIFGATSTKKTKLDEESMVDICKKKGLSDCLKVVTTLDYDALDKAISTGDITQEEIENNVKVTTTYAVLVKVKESVSDVEEVKIAASSKPRRKLGK